MKATALWAAIGAILIFSGTANAWGGLFNRFSPEMLANMGYGSHGGAYRPQAFLQNEILDEEQQNQRIDGEDVCYGRPCYSNENCCPGLVCVNVDGVIGHCMFSLGRKYGEMCQRDSDCESGLVCDISTLSGASVCRPPIVLAKQYAEDCITSSDCDITRGLCCQVQRRHRQVPRKVCSYFKDPLLCIGTVAADQVKHEIQHTAGEKRIIYNKH
ncbi:prohormone-3 isoform X3 [Aedes albopictus]|uniref:Putative prohormone-3 n=1 Tax=Aedes albopictus TaxID=7160 RepID=A0A023EJR4_AEDAL|nr:prohormone-3 isoform X3 [Aedes albopictus]